MKLLTIRDEFHPRSTIGKLYVDGVFECQTLEDCDRKLESGGVKIPKETAIPRGVYKLVIDFSNHMQKTLPHILDVPQFEGIRIHPGNSPKDTEGCLLVGSVRGVDYIYYSKTTFYRLMLKIQAAFDKGEEITYEVT